MSRKRKVYSTEFKTKIVLEVLKGEKYNAPHKLDHLMKGTSKNYR